MYHDTGYSTYADKVQAQVSTNGTTWTNVGTAVNRYTGSTGWTQASIDLSAYKGQTVYLAFVGVSAYGNDEYLDDVTVSAQ
jgi:bacillopeptidase F (M6 metalloprotease family)